MFAHKLILDLTLISMRKEENHNQRKLKLKGFYLKANKLCWLKDQIEMSVPQELYSLEFHNKPSHILGGQKIKYHSSTGTFTYLYVLYCLSVISISS